MNSCWNLLKSRMRTQMVMSMNVGRDLSGLVVTTSGPTVSPIQYSRTGCSLRPLEITHGRSVHSLVVSIWIRFNSPETPVHLDSPDTPFIGRKAFYPNPNENNGNEHGTASNTGGGTESEPNDSTAKPSMNTNQQHRRNNFNRHNQGYRENGQRRQDRHHR